MISLEAESTSIPLEASVENDDPRFNFVSGDDPDFNAGEAAQGEATVAAKLLTKDEFFAAFKMMHHAPNLVPIPPFPVKALPISDRELDAARQASDAIYDIALETPWLRWMIEPGSLWVQRAVAIGAYAVPKAMAVASELKAKGAKPINPVNIDPYDFNASVRPESEPAS